MAGTGRVENDPKLSRFYNTFYLQGDRSATYAERAADCKLARLACNGRHPLALGGALVADEGDRDLRLEDLIAALIGETKR